MPSATKNGFVRKVSSEPHEGPTVRNSVFRRADGVIACVSTSAVDRSSDIGYSGLGEQSYVLDVQCSR